MSGMDRKIEKKKWTLKRLVTISSITAFVLVFGYLIIFQTDASSLNVKLERITVSTVSKGPFQEFIPVIGEVQPLNTFFLDAVEGGRVEKIYVDSGTMLKKGDKILKLSNTNLLLDVMFREAEFYQQSNNLRNTRLLMEQQRLQLKKDMASADYQLITKRREFERYGKLHSENLISQQDYDKIKDDFDYLVKSRTLTKETMEQDILFREQQVQQLETSLRRMENNLEVVKNKLDSLTIKAPVSGYLTSLNAEFIGESKSPGERMGRIDVVDGFKVRAPIDEHYILRVEKGREGIFSISDKDYKLEVIKVFPEVKEGRFEVDLKFMGDIPKDLRRGQSLHIKLALGDLTEAILLPRGAFYQTTGGNWVYVLNESGDVATKRNIKLNRMNTEMYEVVEGLKVGDKVITSGYDTFGDKDRLVLKK